MSQSPSPAQLPRALRWETLDADGVALDRPGRLYYARLASSGGAVAVLHDGPDAAAPVLLALSVPAGGADDWPVVPVSLNFLRGLYVEMSAGATLSLGWNPD